MGQTVSRPPDPPLTCRWPCWIYCWPGLLKFRWIEVVTEAAAACSTAEDSCIIPAFSLVKGCLNCYLDSGESKKNGRHPANERQSLCKMVAVLPSAQKAGNAVGLAPVKPMNGTANFHCPWVSVICRSWDVPVLEARPCSFAEWFQVNKALFNRMQQGFISLWH